jgi:DNA-directed RNA polymerase I subunit RPA1
MPDILTHGVARVGFSFYTPDEIKKISVKRITAPHVYDNLDQPFPNGLNDPAFGVMEKFETCQTCSLNSDKCSGHSGHIELAVPVYHPLLFNLLVKILRGKCFNCHKFRFPKLQSLKLMAKLRLLNVGEVNKAMQIDQLVNSLFHAAKNPKQESKKSKSEEETVRQSLNIM